MATLHWTGAASTDLNNPANFATDGANGTSAASAFSSSDPTNDDIVIQSVALSNVTQNPTVNANVTFKSLLQDAGSTLTGNSSYSISISSRDGTTGKSVDMNGATSGEVNIIIINNLDNDLDLGDDKIHDLTINNDTAARKNYLAANTAITGDLVITRGIFNTFNREFEADGHCSIAANGTFEANANGGKDVTLKSLSIASSGICNATRTTTTITGEGDGNAGSTNGVNLINSGTFKNNQGTVKVTCATQTTLVGFSGTNGFYNYTYAGTGTNEDQVCGGNTDFYGHVIIDSANSEVQMQGHTFNLYGGITIKQGGWDIGSSDESGTMNVYGAARNVGGSVVA